MLLVAVGNLRATFGAGRAVRIVVTGVLVIVATYGLLYWGMVYVPSGVAGVVNMSMNPVFFFALAIVFGQERPTWRHAGALALGIGGLLILFSSKASFGGTAPELWGAAAVVAASLAYCLGSVLTRPLLRDVKPLELTTAQASARPAWARCRSRSSRYRGRLLRRCSRRPRSPDCCSS